MEGKREDPSIAKEIKKEYLREHLGDVKERVEEWIGQLSAPQPFAPISGRSSWGWERVYRPSAEEDSDVNHMLRKHLRSRALWSHHSNWEHKLEAVWDSLPSVRQRVHEKHQQRSLATRRDYTTDYIPTALWQGFEFACGGRLKINYRATEGRDSGLSFGAYLIETLAESDADRQSVQKEHVDLSYRIAETGEMKDLTGLWGEIGRIQESMQALANKALRSNDFLYPCRFCRRWWK